MATNLTASIITYNSQLVISSVLGNYYLSYWVPLRLQVGGWGGVLCEEREEGERGRGRGRGEREDGGGRSGGKGEGGMSREEGELG